MPKKHKPTNRQILLTFCRCCSFYFLLFYFFTFLLFYFFTFLLFYLSSVVVLHLDSKDNDTTRTGNEVGQYQIVVLNEEALYDEGCTANGHRDETRQ